MYISFDQLPPDARIWIYQANRQLTPAEVSRVSAALNVLCEDWKVHGVDLPSSFRVDHSLFIVLGVDEAKAGISGCSIDSSVRVLKFIQEQIGVDFFDRMKIALKETDCITLRDVRTVKSDLRSGILSGEVLTFNTTATTRSVWLNEPLIPIRKSWLGTMIPKDSVAG